MCQEVRVVSESRWCGRSQAHIDRGVEVGAQSVRVDCRKGLPSGDQLRGTHADALHPAEFGNFYAVAGDNKALTADDAV